MELQDLSNNTQSDVLANSLQNRSQKSNQNYPDYDEENQIDSIGIQMQQHDNSIFYTLFPGFRIKSFNFMIVVIQILIFTVIQLSNKNPELDTDPDVYMTQKLSNQCTNYQFGGRYTKSLQISYLQYYREFSSLFVHSDIIQLLINLLILMIYGNQCEKYFSSYSYLFIYLISGVMGNLFASYEENDKVYSGASQSIFGILGMNLIYIKNHYQYMGQDAVSNINQFVLIIFAVFGLFYLDDEVETFAMLVGFAFGIIYTYIIHKNYKKLVLILIFFTILYSIVMIFLIQNIQFEKHEDTIYGVNPCQIDDQ